MPTEAPVHNRTKLENEQELVEKAKTDDFAFEELYNHYFPKLYGYIFKRIGDHHITEDLVSITFMKVFKNLQKYEYRKCSFSAWIYRIATNNLIDHYRKAGKRKEVELDDARRISDEKQEMTDFVAEEQQSIKIRMVLQNMSPRYQKILNLRFFADMTYEEIAEALDLSINNVRVLTHRALKQFEKKVKSYE